MRHLKNFKLFENSGNSLIDIIKYLKIILLGFVSSPELYNKNLSAWRALYGKGSPGDAEYDSDFVIHLENAGNRSTAQERYDEFISDIFSGYNLGYMTYSLEDFQKNLGVNKEVSLYSLIVSRWNDLTDDEYDNLIYDEFKPEWEEIEI